MKQYKLLLVIFLTTEALLGSPAFGQLPGVHPIPQLSQQVTDSLPHYLEIAARNNPKVKADFLTYQASIEKTPQAGALPDPELEIGFFVQPMEILDGKQMADFTLMQMFPWFGTRKSARTEAEHMTNAAFAQFRETRDDLYLQVYTQWFLLCSLQQQLGSSRENNSYLKQLETLALRRYSAAPSGSSASGGSSGMSEVLRIQLEMAELDNSIESIQSQINAEAAAFNALLNRAADSKIHLPDSITLIPFSIDMIATTEQIAQNNPQLTMIDEEGAAYKAKAAMDKKMSYPMLGVGLQYSVIGKRKEMGHAGLPVTEMNGMDMIMPMVSISLPIFRNKYKSQQKESNIRWQASRQRYNDTQNTLQTELFRTKHLLDDASRKVTLYEKQTQLAHSTYQLLLQEFIAGRSELTEIIGVQRQLLDYKLKKAEASAQFNTMVATVQKLISFNNK